MVLACVVEAKSGNLYAGPTKGSEFAVVSTCLFYLDVVRATYLNSSSKLLVEAEISAKVWRQIDGPIDLARTIRASAPVALNVKLRIFSAQICVYV
jgi:hypothetical protein